MPIQAEQTKFVTTDQAVTEVFIALLTEFTKTEAAPLRAYNEAQTSDLTSNDADMANVIKEMAESVDFETDKLMVSRLVANNRKVPLLRASDTHRIVTTMLSGESMDNDVAALMAFLVPFASLTIEGNLVFLAAFNLNPYAGFWQFVAALTTEASSSGRTLKQVVVSPESRANVYRACMSYQTWHKLTTARCALIAGISPSSLFGGAGSLLADEQAVLLDEQLAADDEEGGEQRAEMVTRYKRFYTELGQEIWPAGTRR